MLGLVMVLFRMDISRYLSDITGLLVTGSILSVFEYSDAPEPGVRRVRATIPVGQSQCFGLAIGVVARLLDIFTTNLGEIFSQMAVWILMGTLISIHSRTAKQAMVNVLAFCLGMLLTYYFVAALSHGIYSREFIIGWTVFALCSPVMAYFAWLTKKQGIFPKIVSVGIIAVRFCHPLRYLTDRESMIS